MSLVNFSLNLSSLNISVKIKKESKISNKNIEKLIQKEYLLREATQDRDKALVKCHQNFIL